MEFFAQVYIRDEAKELIKVMLQPRGPVRQETIVELAEQTTPR
jgi:hypothetical protein